MENTRIFDMPFGKVYPLLVQKTVRKGRTKEEADRVILWLTGYSPEELVGAVESEMSCQAFYDGAPAWNPRSDLITGKVCGVQVETVEHPTMKRIRQLDKLIDELAKGKAMEKILR